VKSLHRPDLYSWSAFDEARNVDFHGLCWARPEGNVLVDPMPMSAHDRAHLAALGGRAAERATFPFPCQRWLADGDELVPGLRALALDGSKTPGELALLLEGRTLVTGDLVRAHQAGSLMILPDAKLADRAAALRSLRRLADLPDVDAVLVGDGWPVFHGGGRLLRELALRLGA
jgi:glyoxylase-like metal-dependent hydrolase (beta-lactamase superfamily II)